MSVHHDHNRNEKRAITAMVYLSELEAPAGGGEAGGPGGETFFPCSDCDADDPLLESFEGLLKEGIYIGPGPLGWLSAPSVFLCKPVFYGAFVSGRAGRLTAENGGFRPGQ